jgi:uncharacterized protein (TIGR03083 family)
VPTEIDVYSCLAAIDEASDALATEIEALSAEAWNGRTNCPPWRVSDLAGHVVDSGRRFSASIRNGLAGSADPPASPDARLTGMAAIAESSPRVAARALRDVTQEFAGLYAGLDETALAAVCYHRRGNRPVRWYAAHRLVEVALHSWDLQVSLQREPVLPEHFAALVLPTLLESNAPLMYALGLGQQPGQGERYLLVVDADPSARWSMTFTPSQLVTLREDSQGDVTVAGSAADLVLLVYGRRDLSSLSESGRLRLHGDRSLADRLPLLLPKP